ncbi:hypothetical protein GCM10010275_13500 [Streptomyces litmocidini]|nr:hypothetical protein GCM10010275_13500 [Streptomyces litmocidini]
MPERPGAAVRGQPHADLVTAGGAGRVGGDRRDEDGAPGGTGGRAEPPQTVQDAEGKGLAGVQGEIARGRARAGRGGIGPSPHERSGSARGGAVAVAGGQVGEPSGPVGVVGFEPVGRAVGGLVGDEVAQRTGGRGHGRQVLATRHPRVEVRNGPGEEGSAETVDGYVVVADVPVVQAGTEPQQGEMVPGGVEPVHGGHVVRHVPLRRGDGVVGAREIDPVQPVPHGGRAVDALSDRPVHGHEDGVEAVAEVDRPVEGDGE